MLLVASIEPLLVRCWQHRLRTGPVLAHNGIVYGVHTYQREMYLI